MNEKRKAERDVMRMDIESKVFARKRFVPELVEDYGFIRNCASAEEQSGARYHDEISFMDGDFRASLDISSAGELTGRVIDVMNEEEYAPLRAAGMNGAYVNTVRAAYEELLADIAEKCCVDVLFASDQANRIAAQIREEYSVEPDFPWKKDPYSAAGVFRHEDTRKWFGLIMNVKRSVLKGDAGEGSGMLDVMNLKIDPDDGGWLTEKDGVHPAYHMNHKNWISVRLDDTLSDKDVMHLVRMSFEMTDSEK